ncbi:Arc18 ARP2/3 complex subunit [Ramicandelaber brevisporus]|nr:Arc18 ARP2/3 complex subunit [Ramicandelaber brevisporus]
MPAYHSTFSNTGVPSIGGIPLIGFKTRARGPAPPPTDPNADDCIDEAFDLFRANSFFRNFEIQGDGDRMLIYLILLISDYLGRIRPTMSQAEASRLLYGVAVQGFAVPGDPTFPLNSMYPTPANRTEGDTLRQYMVQLRQEVAVRLPERVFVDGRPSKWWLAFQKRKFMNKQL